MPEIYKLGQSQLALLRDQSRLGQSEPFASITDTAASNGF